MLQCITCSKQQPGDGNGDNNVRGAPTSKDPVKTLASQIKDMVLKLSGVHRQCKPGGGSSSFSSHKKGSRQRQYHNYDSISRTNNYPAYHSGKGGSRNSTPAWDFSQFSAPAETWISGPGVEKAEGGCGWVEEPVVTLEEEEPREWIAQVEPGVHITFLALPQGGNDLKRIRFSRELFNKWQAQRWWGENYDRIMELYNVQIFNQQALNTPPRSDDERESTHSRVGSTKDSSATLPPTNGTKEKPSCHNNNNSSSSSRTPTATSTNGGAAERGMYFPETAPAPDPTEHFFQQYQNTNQPNCGKGEASSVDVASPTTTSSRDEASVSISNASDVEITEWVAEDEPGVYITIRQLLDGTRELRRVRFSRELFGEVHAKLWWEENRERIHSRYL